MNAKFEHCFSDYGLAVNGNTAYGVVNGYEMSVFVNTRDMYFPVTVHISCYATESQRADITAALKNRKDIKGSKGMSEFGVLLRLNDWTAGRMIKRLPEILNWATGMLQANGALGAEYCPHCGKPLNGNGRKCDVDVLSVTLDGDCVGTVNTAIENRNADYENAPNNYLKGFLGALIGGVVGAATVVLFFLIGFVSALSGIIAVALGGFLYAKFGGKPNKMMILIVAVTSLVLLVAAVFVTYLVDAAMAADELGLYSMSAFELFKFCLEIDADYKSEFFSNLALVIVFALLGIGLYSWQLFKNVKKAGKQEKITVSAAPAQTPAAAERENPFDGQSAQAEQAQPEQAATETLAQPETPSDDIQ